METRDRLHQEIEATRLAFHQLLDSIPEEALSMPSDNPAWSIGQVFVHMSIPPRYMFIEVQLIRWHCSIYWLLAGLVPKRLFDWVNAHLLQFRVRRFSRHSISENYDQANKAVLKLLDSLPVADFAKSMHYPNWDPLLSGDVTIEDLFGYIKRHFDSHAAQIKKEVHGSDG